MNVSLYQAASGLNANARWQEIISENLASSTIPGFKRQDLSFEAIQSGMLRPTAVDSLGAGQPVSLPGTKTNLNFTPGVMKSTGVNTDFAIDGPGFFEVQLPDGASGYTRDGEFKIDAQGQLVTKQGYTVMGDTGPIQLDRTSSVGVTVAPDGTVTQGGQFRGKLSVVAFNDQNLLSPAGAGMFLANNPAIEKQPTSLSTVQQGMLEGANTSGVIEMSNLLAAMRGFEANQRVVQMQDERLGRTISELGNPN